MSTNKLLEVLAAYQQLSDREQELFYQVVYREVAKECEDPKETQESSPKEDTSKQLREYLERIKNLPNVPSPISKPVNPFDSIRNYPTLVSINKDGHVAGYGLPEGLYINNDFIK